MQLDILSLSLQYAQTTVPSAFSRPVMVRRLNNGKFLKNGIRNNMAVSTKEKAEFLDVLCVRLEQAVLNRRWEEVFDLARSFFKNLSGVGYDLDMEEDEMVRETLIYVTGILSKASLDMAQLYRKIWEEKSAAKIELIEIRDAIFLKIGNDQKEAKEAMDAIKATEGLCRQLEEDIDVQMAEEFKARQELAKIDAKISEVKKWCWVPFYNLHLYLDAENAKSHWNEREKILIDAKKRLDNAMQERAALKDRLSDLIRFEEEAKKRIDINGQRLQQCEKDISIAKKNVLQYSDIACFWGSVNQQLQYSDADIQIVSDVLKRIEELFDKFPDIGKEMKR